MKNIIIRIFLRAGCPVFKLLLLVNFLKLIMDVDAVPNGFEN